MYLSLFFKSFPMKQGRIASRMKVITGNNRESVDFNKDKWRKDNKWIGFKKTEDIDWCYI